MSDRILIVAEHDGKTLSSGTLATVEAASQISRHANDAPLDLLLIGEICDGLVQSSANLAQLSKVVVISDPRLSTPLSERLAPMITAMAEAYSHILVSASSFGKDLSPRIAALLDVGQLSDVIAIEAADTVIRPIYAGNALARVSSQDSIIVMTIRESAFDKVSADQQASVSVEAIDVDVPSIYTEMLGQVVTESARPDLSAADVVISGGRGVGSKENFAMVEALADKLGGAIGASRAAVDAGFVTNDLQVGQTGKIVAPRLYIAIGISGAIQHLAGMKDSKVIVAINSDPDAPIFEIADYGLVGDLFTLLPELIEKIDA
ncbi:electron transfer flavoprotein subunit alpha/FixB family protein [Vibrio brasiliensis]|uniref:Electron transfer flavoprotein subunit alpha n=1 Tax=Vibrio brasiliensis LMG 20546 TaxID=945543 RepID=E8LUV9_9VIBR|nr:FAD-binding protein [Vibrio brasiliensis]EGA65344.1 acyl-CoA dehydrogenase, short-chain specific [Vibrio brasiliensis LMG 20546]